jgi:UDP-N-acetylmuramate--alanine ligase
MKTIPLSIGPIHFVGIGGIGMSGIAEVLRNLGYEVQGSDVSENANVKRLRGIGVTVHIGHKAENLGSAGVVVISSAIKTDNPEVAAARVHLVPVVRRAEMLAELMRLKAAIAVAGTHGKTTTTSMIAAMLDAAGVDPTVINGGVINAYGTNARLGAGEWVVVEADESDGTFVKLPAMVAVITNIDPEHMEFWGTFDKLRDGFRSFVENIPFYGFAALCVDHPEVQALIPRVPDRKIVTYGFNPQADVRATEVQLGPDGAHYDVVISDRMGGPARTINGVHLPMYGRHNVQNSLAAVAVGHQLGFDPAVMKQALQGFKGVKRRFTRTGSAAGITVIDDYGHHPVEIAAVLRAARSASAGQVIAVVQPHRYSRLANLFEEFCTCFNDADAVIVADVYAAGETPLPNASRDALVEGLRAHGHRRVIALSDPSALPKLVLETAHAGDFVVCLGAGNITAWANALPTQLEALSTGRPMPQEAGE